MSRQYQSLSAAKILHVAGQEVGYREGRDRNGNWNNQQKFSPAVPGLEWSQGQAWCATFVSWCAMKAGYADLYPRTASTDTGAAWFKGRGQWSEYPAIGAQGFLGVRGDMFHTFLVEDFDDTYVYTIEGNTNDDGSPQGDGVYRLRRRRDSSSIAGYGYPKFKEGVVSADPKQAAKNPKPGTGPVRPGKPPAAQPVRTPNIDEAVATLIKAIYAGQEALDGRGPGPVLTHLQAGINTASSALAEFQAAQKLLRTK